jgi:uncharacterized sporulation protein YeaH/YhbH (DUF444 family)
VRHHTEAKEVDETEFFESKESGGTIVLPALKLADKIIDERYSNNCNVYIAQASDGDVWDRADAFDCYEFLSKNLLQKVQYMIYVEVCRTNENDLWSAYKSLKSKHSNFEMGKINEVTEIWPIFQDFFKKKVD